MDDVGKAERAQENYVRRPTEFEVGFAIDDARAGIPRRARVDGFDDEARAPSFAGLAQDADRRVDDFCPDSVPWQADELDVDHDCLSFDLTDASGARVTLRDPIKYAIRSQSALDLQTNGA